MLGNSCGAGLDGKSPMGAAAGVEATELELDAIGNTIKVGRVTFSNADVDVDDVDVDVDDEGEDAVELAGGGTLLGPEAVAELEDDIAVVD